jgi:multidrug efflux system outer membrane protein
MHKKRMKAKRLFYYLLMIQLLVSCMVGKKYKTPDAPTDIAYRDTVFTDTSKLMSWFDLYSDPTLTRMIKAAIDSNRDLLTAAARIEEARFQAASIKANIYPSLNYSATAGGGKAGTEAQKIAGGIQGGFLNAFALLNWEVDIWGKLRHANRAAVARYLSIVQNRNALQVSLVAEVASQYFFLRDLDNRLMIAQQTLISRRENTRIISERFAKGYIPELDKLQAIQQEAIAAATIPALQRQIVQTENALRLLMGLGPGATPRGLSNFEQLLSPQIPVGLPSQLLQRRPDIMAAEKSMNTQFELAGVAQANRFPTFSLTGVLGFASPQLSTFISSSGLVANGFGSLAGPIFNFNQRKNIVEAERQKVRQEYYQYQQTVLGAFGDVDNALAFYKTYTEEYEQRRIQAEAAARALTLSRARYDFGYTSYTEVVIAENVLFDAQFQQSQTLQGKLNSIVLLYKALGGGW